MNVLELTVKIPTPHDRQLEFIRHPAKRKVVRAGRRSGKTVGVAILAVEKFMDGRRILYATPTQEQIDRFWHEIKIALENPIEAGVYYKNETRHIIEKRGTEQRIRCKTAWDADTLRGDTCDLLILDEYQLMNPEAWELVGVPMLLDNNGDAIFIFTERRGIKGRHARDIFAREQTDPRWKSFVFTSHDNPHISKVALNEIARDMTHVAYRAEILAEESGDDPLALWNRDIIRRVTKVPELTRVVVGVDPPGSPNTECGIVCAGVGYYDGQRCGFVLDDASLKGSPGQWGDAAVTCYFRNLADRLVGEKNYGGDMVESTIRNAEHGGQVAYASVTATRGKTVRAEPVAALYERGLVYHVGTFAELEDELCSYVPDKGLPSPNRYDALVWALTELGIVVDDEFGGIHV